MTKTIKVLYSTNYHKSSTPIPRIQMEGKWLQELGFAVGDLLTVEYEDGAIHIRLMSIEERAMQQQKAMEAAAQRHRAALAAITEEQDRLAMVAEAGHPYASSVSV